MKWIGGTGLDSIDVDRAVIICDDVSDDDRLGRIALAVWRTEQAIWRREHGIQEV